MNRSASPWLHALPALALILAALALFAAPGVATADDFPVCGDGVCTYPETNGTCQTDCHVCGDGVCSFSESCGSCLTDCANRCITLGLPDPLKQPGCSGDDDRDCLDNIGEQDLAFLFSPHYFYDEDESCSGAWYAQNPHPTNFGRRDFYQVRPKGEPHTWQSDATVKQVDLTYFLLHPHDCRDHLGFAGHQGDSEHVVFRLKSLNLVDWTLTSADYYHHGGKDYFSGRYLKDRAGEIGTVFPSIAADEDSHGSWPGRVGSSSDCAGSEDDGCYGTCDCFRGSMAGALQNNYREFLDTSKNIGGPPPESWRPQAVSLVGNPPNQHARTVLDVGHGTHMEFWTPRTDSFKKFCGWECSARLNSGNCAHEIFSESSCSSPLSDKVDSGEDFTPPPFVVLPPQWEYELEVANVLQDGISALVRTLSHLPSAEIDAWIARVYKAVDPVGVVSPPAAGRPVTSQRETLRWILEGPAEKHEAAMAPAMLLPERLTREEIDRVASAFLGGLVALLDEVGGEEEPRF